MVSKKLPYDTNGLPYDIYMGDSRPQCSLEWLTTYVTPHLNPSDIMTKSVSSINNIIRKVRKLLYDIYPEVYDER